MQTYIFLVKFTDQGMRNIKDTIGRADGAFKAMAEKSGAVHQDAVLDHRPLRRHRGVRGA